LAFPHPQSRKDNYRKGDIPNNGGVIRNLFKRTVNITDYRNAKDDVNPAKNRTLSGIFHNWFVNSFIGRKRRQRIPRLHAEPARELLRLLQPGLDLFLVEKQLFLGVEIDGVVPFARRQHGLEGATAEEQQLDVRLKRVDGRDPAVARQPVERHAPL
jgi:hypothetical protein